MAAQASLRLFVALYPSPQAARAMLAALRGVKVPPHRAVPPEQVHLTLHFIGSVPPDLLEPIVEGIRLSAEGTGPFSLAPQRLIALPPRGAARLIAAELDLPPALLELHRRLAASLPAQRDEGDRFLPHMTLCRFKQPARVPPLEGALRIEPFPVVEVALMRSTLRPGGAVHERVELLTLSSSAPGSA